MHSPDGEKRGGADAAISLAPLVMQVVVAGRFAPGYNAADQELVALCEAPHNKRM